jgi:hypothetical protein
VDDVGETVELLVEVPPEELGRVRPMELEEGEAVELPVEVPPEELGRVRPIDDE